MIPYLRSLFVSGRQKSAAKPQPRYRPRFDVLEQRLAPAVIIVDPVNGPNLTIQAGVIAAAAGDTIKVLPGTYAESVTVNKDNLRILGAKAGKSVTTRAAAVGFPVATVESIVTGAGVAGEAGFNITADGVRIDGFVIDITDTSDMSGIKTAADKAGHLIQYNIIQDNTIGIYLDSDGTSQTVVKANLIRDNNVLTASAGTGIYSDGGLTNARITGNKFVDNENYAMLFAAGAAFSHTQLRIDKNIVDGDSDANGLGVGGGIFLFNTTNSRIEKNTIKNLDAVAATGIFFAGGNSGVVVQSNKLSMDRSNVLNDGGYYGIRMNDLSTSFLLTDPHPNSSNTITKNTISGFGYGGISLAFNSIGNIITSNRVSAISFTTFGDGINLEDNAHDNFVSRNVTFNNNRSGIRVEADVDGADDIPLLDTPYANTFSRNIASGNTGLDLFDGTTGTRTAGTDNIWIDNIADDASPPGLIN